jgi:glycosyltransferase involved in cell wall biosynthesis
VRIALVHSFYSSRQPSGENVVVRSELNALRRAGHDVELFSAHTDSVEGDLLYPIRSALRVATGYGASPLKAIRKFGPDVVHIHNLFPNFGRRWVEDIEPPVIHTVHNFRPLCANGLLFRDGMVCTECPDGKRWSGLQHACYRESRLATLPHALANRAGPAGDPLFRRADRLIMLTEQQRGIYARYGVPIQKMVVGPNFLSSELDPGPPPSLNRAGYLFVGRLSEEKGIRRLLEHWPNTEPLTIIGDGPQRSEIATLATKKARVHVLGARSRSEILQSMQRHRSLVFPSLWLEGLPMVYLEALACGLSVIAFSPTVLADLAVSENTGVCVDWQEPWPALITQAEGSLPGTAACRRVFEERYSEAAFRSRTKHLLASLHALDNPKQAVEQTAWLRH